MDKIVFEASGVCATKSEYFELVKMNKRHKERKIRPILLTCSAVSIAFCIYDLIILETIMAMISAGFAFLMFYSTTFSYMLDAQKTFEQDKNRVLNVTMKYTFYDNRFSVLKKAKESFFSYNKINDVRQSSKKLYFFTEDRTYYIDKSRLDGVSAEEIKKYLNTMRKK